MMTATGQPIPPLYASLFRRFNAYGIDATIVLLLAWIVEYLLLGNPFARASGLWQLNDLYAAAETGVLTPELLGTVQASLSDSMFGGSIIPVNIYCYGVVSAIYNILFVLGRWQATPGKHWLRCKVVGDYGERLSIGQAILRHAVSGVSMWPLGLGYLTIFWTKEHLAPHDMVAKTSVIVQVRN